MDEGIRINKYLSQAGILSRRKADEAVQNSEVTINDLPAETGSRVMPGDIVKYKGQIVEPEKLERVVIAYNKPLGLVCTSKEADKDSIFYQIDYPEMLHYVGRLDKNSQGLLLLTNDVDLATAIQSNAANHEKEYVVRVDKPLTARLINGMKSGVPLEVAARNDYKRELNKTEEPKIRMTKKCDVIQTGKNTFRIILTEGVNKQIRRMCEYFGYRVTFLKRVRVMNIGLGNLPVGQYRQLTKNEEATLRSMIEK